MDLFAIACLLGVVFLMVFGDRYLYLRTRAEGVDEGEYLVRRAPVSTAKLYTGPGEGRLVCPLRVSVAPAEHTLSVTLRDDPVYRCFELWVLDDETQGHGALAIMRRHKGSPVVLRSPDVAVPKGWFPADPDPTVEVTAIEAEVELEPEAQGVRARFDFTDPEGRAVQVRLQEDAAPPRRTAFLAPWQGPPGTRLSHLAVVLLDQARFLPRRERLSIAVDGEPRRPARFVVPVDGRLSCRAYYALAPIRARLGSALDGELPWIEAQASAESEEGHVALPTGETLTFVLRDGHAEIRRIHGAEAGAEVTVDFAPALPDLAALRPGARARGRFAVALSAHRAVVAGTWAVRQEKGPEGAAELVLRPVHAWQPGPGALWVQSLRFTARVQPQEGGDPRVEAGWERI